MAGLGFPEEILLIPDLQAVLSCRLMVASTHKTELPGDQVLEVLATCCLPQLLGHPQQIKYKIKIKSSQGYNSAAYLITERAVMMIRLTSQPAVWKALGMVRAPVPTIRLNTYTRPTYKIEGKDP